MMTSSKRTHRTPHPPAAQGEQLGNEGFFTKDTLQSLRVGYQYLNCLVQLPLGVALMGWLATRYLHAPQESWLIGLGLGLLSGFWQVIRLYHQTPSTTPQTTTELDDAHTP
jgi:hypothetical protein